MYGQYKYGQYKYGEKIGLSPEVMDSELVKLLDYLPSYYQEGLNIIKLMQIIDSEIGELNYYSKTLGEQFSLLTATWGLNTWENELGIPYNPSATMIGRREIALAKIRGRGTTTKEMIMIMAQAFSGGEVAIIEHPDQYYFEIRFIGVRGIPRNMQAFIDILESIKPAHLGYEFKYTFTTCQMLKDWNVLCSDIKEVTCKELMTYNKQFNQAYTTCQYLFDMNMTCSDLLEFTNTQVKLLGRSEVI